MKINRNNYEEFFLLYIDNELSAADRREVEDFAEENTDLKSELEALQQTTLKPDRKVTFENKAALMLFSSGEECINAANYQQHFVEYLDNELDQAAKASVEEFVYRHPQFQEEFELIQELRLAPDLSVVYDDKKSLYHSETRKPVNIPWWRIAAAAAVLFMAGMLWLKIQPDATPVQAVADVDEATVMIDSLKSFEPAPGSGIKTGSQPPVTALDKVADVKPSRLPEDQVPRVTKNSDKKPSENQARNYQEAAGLVTNKSPEKVEIEQGTSHQLPVNTDLASEDITPVQAQVKLIDTPATVAETGDRKNEARLALMDAPEDENTFLTNIPIGRKSPVSRAFRKASRFIQKTTDLATARKAGIQIGNIEIAFQ